MLKTRYTGLGISALCALVFFTGTKAQSQDNELSRTFAEADFKRCKDLLSGLGGLSEEKAHAECTEDSSREFVSCFLRLKIDAGISEDRSLKSCRSNSTRPFVTCVVIARRKADLDEDASVKTCHAANPLPDDDDESEKEN